MDLREYEYFTHRPDTFPKSTLQSIQLILSQAADLDSAALIDQVLSTGYIKPPREYPWHGYYQILLGKQELQSVINGLHNAKAVLSFSSEELHHCNLYIDYLQRCLTEEPQDYAEFLAGQPYYDLKGCSLAYFQAFLFDRDITEDDEESKYWYLDINLWIEANSEHIANLYIQMFSNADQLLQLFSEGQLERGLWMIMNSGLQGYTAYDLVWENKIDVALKEQLIYSMFDLYRTLFAVKPFNQVCNMWWDSIGYRFYRIINPVENSEYQHLQHVMFVTLQKILQLDSVDCQFAALHGLGHVRHPENAGVIQAYIRQHQQTLTADDIAYAEACVTGDIM